MRVFIFLACLFIVAGCAHNAGMSAESSPFDGTWSGRYDSGMGEPMDLTFTFRAAGNRLRGTAPGGPGSRIRIRNGEIDGDKISFSYTVDYGGMDMTFNYTGVLKDDEIELAFETEIPGAPPAPGGEDPQTQKFTVRRVE